MSPNARRRVQPGVVAGLGVLVLIAMVALSGRGDPPSAPTAVTKRKIDLVASVDYVNIDSGWSQDGGVTRGGMRLSLDDLRDITVHDGTLVDDYEMMPPCAEFTVPNACVLLADMLGDAVVWFALVPADKVSGREILTMPGLVDMQSNGDEGVLRNGWIVKLATPVARDCEKQDTPNLRDFITRFPDTASQSIMDLTSDSIVRVRCL